MANRIRKQPTSRKAYSMMLTLNEEYLILKTLMKMFDEALKKADPVLMLEISVDIAESAEKLEQKACDYANGH